MSRRSRLLTASLSAVVVVAFALGAQAADDDPKVIVAKAIKAHGGEEFLTKNKAAQLKSQGKLNIPGVGETPFTQDTAYMLPEKFRETLELKVMGQTLTILTLIDGDKVTLELNGQEIPGADKVKEAMKGVGHVMMCARMVPLLKEKGYELNLIGEDKVEGKKVIGVRVSKKDQKDVNLFFDQETNLLAKVEFKSVAPGTETEVTEERIVMEYMKKDGIPYAKKLVIKHDGKQFMEAEVLEVKYLEKLDDSEFRK